MYEIKIDNLKEMESFGIKLGKALRSKDIVSLIGELGAGKTTLTKSIGVGLGVEEYITSPTFALINEYNGKDFYVYHFDVYRLENIDSLDDLGFDDYFYSKGINIIEWGDKIEEFLPKEKIDISIDKGEDLNSRIIKIFGYEKRVNEIIEELNK